MKRTLIILAIALLAPAILLAQLTREGGAVQRPGGGSSEFTLAAKLYSDGMYDLARTQFKQFIEKYPQSQQTIEAQFYLGLSELALRDYEEARRTFQNYALTYQDQPKAPEAWWHVAECYSAQRNYREAALAFDRLTVFYPKSSRAPDALLAAGGYFMTIGDTADARRSYRNLAANYAGTPQMTTARMKLAGLMAADRNLAGAKAELQHIISATADQSQKLDAQVSLASLLEHAGEWDQSGDLLSGLLKQVQGEGGKDILALRKVSLALGNHALALGDAATAREKFRIAADTSFGASPTRPAAMFGVAMADFRLRRPADAADDFRTFERTYPSSDSVDLARMYRARSLVSLKRFAEAMDELRPLTSAETATGLRLSALGLGAEIEEGSGQYRSAAQLLEQLLDLRPPPRVAQETLFRLVEVYGKRLRDVQRASNALENLMENYPAGRLTDDALFTAARFMARLNGVRDALKYLDELHAQFPASDHAFAAESLKDSLKTYAALNTERALADISALIAHVVTGSEKGEILFGLGTLQADDLKDYETAASSFGDAARAAADQTLKTRALVRRAQALHAAVSRNSKLLPQAMAAADEALQPASGWDRSAIELILVDLAAQSRDTALAARSAHAILSSLDASDSLKAEAAQKTGRLYLDMKQPDRASEWLALGSGLTSRERRSEIEQLRGEALLLAGKPDSAHELYVPLVESSGPEAPAALWNLFRLDRASGRIEAALRWLEILRDRFSYTSLADSAEAELPSMLRRLGRPGDAAQMLLGRIAEVESDPFAATDVKCTLLRELGESYDAAGRLREAQDAYLEAIRLAPSATDAAPLYHQAAMVLKRSGNMTTAIWSLQRSAEVAGNSGSAVASAATEEAASLLLQQGTNTEAIRLYQDLLKSSPDAGRQRAYRSSIIIATYRLSDLAGGDRLRREFVAAYRKAPEDETFAYERALGLFKASRYDEAKEAFETFADDYSRSPHSVWASYWIGKIEEATGQAELAGKSFNRILNKHPESDVIPRVVLSLGNLAFRREKYDEAALYYRMVTDSLKGDSSIVPYAMGSLIESYKNLGWNDAALDYTRRFIQMFPNDESIPDRRVDVGVLYEKLGYYDQALLHLQNLLEGATPDLEAEMRYYIGECYFRSADYEQAILEFLKVPYLVTKPTKIDWRATAFYMAGQSYEKMGKYEQAIGMYQQIIDRPGIDGTFKAGAEKEIKRVRTLITGGVRP